MDALTQGSIAQLDAVRAELGLSTPTLDGGLLMAFSDPDKLKAMADEAEASFAEQDRASRYRVVSAAEGKVELEYTGPEKVKYGIELALRDSPLIDEVVFV